MAAISIQQVSKAFGGVHAVEDCSFEIASGSITGVIGPNGAGKSTLFNILAGLLKPDSGTVWLDGKNVTGWSPHQLADLGILRTFQIAHEYARMSVKDNLMVAPQGQPGVGCGRIGSSGLRSSRKNVNCKNVQNPYSTPWN